MFVKYDFFSHLLAQKVLSELPHLFECTHYYCNRYIDSKDENWGYYYKNDGNCTRCMELCYNDPNCGSLECQENGIDKTDGYCIWIHKKCDKDSLNYRFGNGPKKTCMKIS